MLTRILGIALVAAAALAPRAAAFDPLDTSHAYDYVVLTADAFAPQASAFVGLHPNLRSCLVRLSEVQAAFPSGTTIERIRAFTVYAYQNWKIAPTYLLLVGDANMVEPEYDFLPTLVAQNPYYNWGGVDWYANEGYYVASPVAGQVKPVMHLGRVSARTAEQVTNAYTKVNQYQQISGTPAWLQKILMLVGDARINEFPGDPPNATYRTLNDQLRATELASWNQSNITTYYAETLRQAGQDRTAVTRNAWNAGYGLVNALGNTQEIDWLVFMAYFNLPNYILGDGNPTFTESLNSTNYLPVVYGNTCFTNWFHRRLELSVAEDLLFSDPTKGAVAVIGPSHQADMVETYAMNETFVHELVTNGVRNIGRLYSTARAKFAAENQGHAVFADQYCLLGDPALDIKLGPLPSPTAYRSGIEIEDAPLLQDQVISKTADITGENVRVVNQASGVSLLQGERMLKVALTDAAGTPGSIEWKLQDLNLPITQNMILSFWLNVQSTPSGNGKLVLDGNTSLGRIKDRLDIFDQNGVRLDAKLRPGVEAGWKFYYADLSPLRGGTLQDLRLRYETLNPADAGALLAYIDNIRVERYESVESQELVNHSLEDDVDGNGTPDFWTDLIGAPTSFNALRSSNFAQHGTHSLLVQDLYANGGGAKQIFTANIEAWAYTMQVRYYAPDPTTARFRVRDLEAGTLLLDVPVSASPSWQTVSPTFGNPYYGVRPARFAFEIAPQDPMFPVYMDNIEMYPPVVVGVEDRPSGSSTSGARLLGAWPNPGRLGRATSVDFELPREAKVAIELFDISGRKVGELPERSFSSGRQSAAVAVEESKLPRGGLCFVRLRVDGVSAGGARKVAILP
jgi:hypothetical protein